MQTNVPHIYAVRDVNKKIPLVYADSMEGRITSRHAADECDQKMNYDLVANIIFSHPEIGTVDLTEVEAKTKGFKVITVKTSMEDIGKGVAIGETDSFVKMVTEKPSGRILDLHILSPHTTDIMKIALPHIYHKDTVFDVLNIPYPLLDEMLSYLAEEIVYHLTQA